MNPIRDLLNTMSSTHSKTSGQRQMDANDLGSKLLTSGVDTSLVFVRRPPVW